ncbi:damage-inducible protein DinB [Pigmentiphaga aceris]|uniref:Damage-inducible protein DinB n=1 Tax=Pigmentiphaga aceris TaxID=1940612 RepID=A0A5C0B1A6_9BURK|nr:DinB family protein [Pigmentiphaga aceris]QEI07543.1 damage-inducible protein DinB [Pigmentiphaga aceris]
MTAASPFSSLFKYQAWANDAFLQALDTLHASDERHTAIRIMNHCHVVNLMFKGHLSGVPHGFSANNTLDTPTPQDLRTAMASVDSWYLNYAATVTATELAEPITFVFSDGDSGCMTREEMLLHVATHGTYHRGEVGRVLKQIKVAPPWDTFAVHLHQADPSRRLRA